MTLLNKIFVYTTERFIGYVYLNNDLMGYNVTNTGSIPKKACMRAS